MKRHFRYAQAAAVMLALGLSGCGGGGSSSVISDRSFTAWSDIDPPRSIVVEGISTERTYTAPAPGFKVTDLGPAEQSTTTTTTLTYNSSGNLTKIVLTTPYSSVTWDEASDDLIIEDTGVIGLASEDEASLGLIADAIELGWDFQTFGTWATGFGTGAGRTGAFSIGARTLGRNIPTDDTATFEGLTLGSYIDGAGQAYSTVSALSVDVDFRDRTLDFSTRDTEKVNLDTAFTSAAGNLDLTGTLTYQLGVNSFSGAVNATGLSGTAKGRFYGPNAEELGGYFDLHGAGVETYIGGFGAGQ